MFVVCFVGSLPTPILIGAMSLDCFTCPVRVRKLFNDCLLINSPMGIYFKINKLLYHKVITHFNSKAMEFHTGQFYHVYNRTNNQEHLFKTTENYLYFLEKMKKLRITKCSLLAYCLMPTHFHWLLHTHSDYAAAERILNETIGSVLSSYTQAINRQFKRTGSLFQAGTKSKNLGEDGDHLYPISCFHYIHQNPIRAELVDSLEDWPFSSYRDYAGLRSGKLPEVEKGYEFFEINGPEDFKKKSSMAINEKIVKKLF